jgi:glucose-1-phosphate thymidylyltransferase
MITFVLAGGYATRLWPLTKERPKPLLPLGRSTILDHLLHRLGPTPGRVVVSTNAKFEAAFVAWRKGGKTDVELIVAPERSEEEKSGALAAIHTFVKTLSPPQDLLVLGGDNVLGFELGEFVAAAAKRSGPTVACVDVRDRATAKRFGVVKPGDGSLVLAFHEKPENPPSTLVSTAVYYYPAASLSLFDEYATDTAKDGRKARDAPGRILEWAAPRGVVHHHDFGGAWFDVGSLDGYIQAQAHVVGRLVEGDVSNCRLGARVFIYSGARVTKSNLEDVVIFPGAVVEASRLQRVGVDEGAYLQNVHLEESMVGAHSRLCGSPCPLAR